MNTTTTTITVRTSAETKSKAQKLFSELGMDLSTAINTFLKQSVREQGLPFCPRDHTPNEETIKAMEEAERGENLIGPFKTVEEAMKYLNA